MTEAEKIAIDRIGRAIEKDTGKSMEHAARVAMAALNYMRNAGLEIRLVA